MKGATTMCVAFLPLTIPLPFSLSSVVGFSLSFLSLIFCVRVELVGNRPPSQPGSKGKKGKGNKEIITTIASTTPEYTLEYVNDEHTSDETDVCQRDRVYGYRRDEPKHRHGPTHHTYGMGLFTHRVCVVFSYVPFMF